MKLKDGKRIFRAFADETRLRILNLLSEGELCVCDVMGVLREPQSKVSRHLSYLRQAGLVASSFGFAHLHLNRLKPYRHALAGVIVLVSGLATQLLPL